MRVICFHLNQIGDLLFSLPALKSLKEWDPDCSITSVVRPACRMLLERTGLTDSILVRESGLDRKKVNLFRQLRSIRPDAAVLFSQSMESMILAKLSGAPNRYGITTPRLDWLLTHHVKCSRPPSISNNLSVLAMMGCPGTCNSYIGLIRANAEDREEACALLMAHQEYREGGTKIVIAPGTSSRRSVKAWTVDGWAAVIDRFSALRDCVIITVGTDDVSDILSRTRGRVINLCGKTSLTGLMAVLEMADVVIGVDSGILHLAAALGTQVVGLYGMSDPGATGPLGSGHLTISAGVDCSPCQLSVCKNNNRCMTEIDSNTVVEAVESIISVKTASG